MSTVGPAWGCCRGQGQCRSGWSEKGVPRHRFQDPIPPGKLSNALPGTERAHPLRVGSSYMLSGPVKCYW